MTLSAKTGLIRKWIHVKYSRNANKRRAVVVNTEPIEAEDRWEWKLARNASTEPVREL